MDTLKYKNYEGTCEIDVESEICYGKILFIDDLITYEAETPKQLKKEFEVAVDDYIETCKELGIEPKKALKGVFNIRVSPELHKEAVLRSRQDDVSLNDVVKSALECYLYSNYDVNHNVSIVFQSTGTENVIPVTASQETKWVNVPSYPNLVTSNVKH